MQLPQINKNWLLLGLAVLLGIGAMLLSNNVIQRRMGELEADAKRGQDMVRLVVANRDMDKGETVQASDLAVRSVPRQWAHSTAVLPNQVDDYTMQRLATPIKRGEVLLQSHMEGKGANVFSANLKKGWRALTFEVDTVNSISGMLRPGDRIDLIYTGKSVQQSEEQTLPLLSNVTVLATGQSITKTDEETGKERTFSTVTLEVSPMDADRIIVAKSGGKVTALLRHPDDKAPNATRPLYAASLLGATGRNADTVEYIIGGGGGLAQMLQGEVAHTTQAANRAPAAGGVRATPGRVAADDPAAPPADAADRDLQLAAAPPDAGSVHR